MKTNWKGVLVKFEDSKYNYKTSVNANRDDESIIKYFVGQIFNLGNVEDNCQKCIEIEITS